MIGSNFPQVKNLILMNHLLIKKTVINTNQQEGPNLIAFSINANVSITGEKPEHIPPGAKYSVRLRAKGAKFLSLFFDEIDIAPGSEMFIYNPKENVLVGPINNENHGKSNHLQTGLVKGDELIITLFEDIRVIGKSSIHLEKLYYGGAETSDFGFGNALSCNGNNKNAKCPEGLPFSDQSDAVAMVLIPVPEGIASCSATLLNNACQNLKPNLLTAFHCLDVPRDGILSAAERADVANWSFIFQYRSPNCNNSDVDNYITVMGSKLLSAWNQTDFALLELNSRPTLASGIKYAGWSRSAQTPIKSFGFHHPKKDIMKVAIENNPATLFTWDNSVVGNFTPNTTDAYWQTDFDIGTTENGSSGSALFDENRRVIGQLRGNLLRGANVSQCDDKRAHYGRLDLSWNGGGAITSQLSSHLTDAPSVTQTNTVGIPSFTFPDVICGPTPMTIDWNGMSNMNMTGGSIQGITGSSVTSATQLWFEPVPNFAGSGFLNVNFKPNGITCNTPLVISKNFHVGNPTTPTVQLGNDWFPCENWLVASGNVNDSYEWVIHRNYGNQYFYQQNVLI
jgi:lysyl endopeptidase